MNEDLKALRAELDRKMELKAFVTDTSDESVIESFERMQEGYEKACKLVDDEIERRRKAAKRWLIDLVLLVIVLAILLPVLQRYGWIK